MWLVQRIDDDGSRSVVDQLVARAMSGVSLRPEEANALLDAYFKGRDSSSELVELLKSPSDEVAASAAWIASEIGGGLGRDGLFLSFLTTHRCLRVRFWIASYLAMQLRLFDPMLTEWWATCILDADRAVRWAAADGAMSNRMPVAWTAIDAAQRKLVSVGKLDAATIGFGHAELLAEGVRHVDDSVGVFGAMLLVLLARERRVSIADWLARLNDEQMNIVEPALRRFGPM